MPHTNEVIVSFVTSGAWIHLYAYLDKLHDRAIYTDTDCHIHTKRRRAPSECGDTLGSTTNELQPGEFIDEFVSGGPKIMLTGSSIEQIPQRHRSLCKVRGITLNYSASQNCKLRCHKGHDFEQET